jgi:hypothetical protein
MTSSAFGRLTKPGAQTAQDTESLLALTLDLVATFVLRGIARSQAMRGDRSAAPLE